MYKVEVVSYDELTEEDKGFGLSNNGHGKEFASYLRIIHNGKVINLESDAMEPEDVCFGRDLSWIAEALQEAYELGRKDEKWNNNL